MKEFFMAKNKQSSNSNTAQQTNENNNEFQHDKYAPFESSKTSFFQTKDHFIDSMDDKNIVERIQSKYPQLTNDQDEQELKKYIVLLINDKKFVEDLFAWYSIDEFDLIKLLYQYFGNVFKGPFLKKIKLEMKDKTYATTTQRHIRKAKSKS